MMGNVKYGRATLFVLLFLMGMAEASTQLELPVWQRNYTGIIAGKPVSVDITRVDDTLEGRYCYEPCTQRKARIFLSGSFQGKRLLLEERVEALTGYWDAEILSGEIKGEWTSADKKRRYPIALRYNQPKNDPGIDLSLVAEADANYDPTKKIDCNNVPAISAIKLYRDGKLIQTLDTDSIGTCSVFIPQWEDVNFDGYQDLSIAQFLPAGPNIPQQTWLYDVAKQRYVDAPATYQEITSPETDAEHQQIVSYWRGGCCNHGINVYRWKGNEIEQVDSGESYLQPVMSKGKMYTCYVIPSYADGRILYPIERKKGHLTTFPLDETCDAFQITTNIRTVIQPEKRDASPESIEIQWLENKASPGRLCPLVPFIDGDKLSPRLVTDDDIPGTCTDRNDDEGVSK